jgi:hypothetical protein
MSLLNISKCNKCGETKPQENMKTKKLCKECHNTESRERYKFKQKIILDTVSKGETIEIKCAKCKNVKSSTEFSINFRNCKDCESILNKEYRIKNEDRIIQKKEELYNLEKRACSHCKIEKTKEEFGKKSIFCKECTSFFNKKKYQNNREKYIEQERKRRQYLKDNNIVPTITEKTCSKCKVIKLVKEFGLSTRGYNPSCNECRKIESKEYRDSKREEIKIRARNSYKEKGRTLNSIVVKLRKNVLRTLSVNPLESSTKKAKELLGIDMFIFQEWLKFNCERDNLDYNSRSNSWHIDHVIPCNLFKLTTEQDEDIKPCFHWTNMVPLEAKKNISKQDKIVLSQTELVKSRLKEFLNIKNLDVKENMKYWNSIYNEKINNVSKLKILQVHTGSQ